MFTSSLRCLLVLAISSIASASLYPTQPLADTIYSAGHTASITWIDDGLKPHISNLGNISLDLYGYNGRRDQYLITLAEGILPSSRSCKVYIPSNLGSNHSAFTLRFISKDPVLTIYTANFAIRPFSSNTLSNSTAIEPSPTTQAPVDPAPSNDMQPFFLTLVMPNSTVVSELPLRPSPTPVTTYYAGEEHYNSSPGPGQFQPKNKPYSASLSRSAVVDLEKLKFRIIFILWPALMGITMSI